MKTYKITSIIVIIFSSFYIISCDAEIEEDNNVEESLTFVEMEEENNENEETSFDNEPVPQETPAEIIAGIGSKWIPLTDMDGNRVIYEECHYGSGYIYFDENGESITYSGGGDQWHHDILSLKWVDYNKIEMIYEDPMNKGEKNLMITISGGDFIIFNEGKDSEEHYVLNESASIVSVIEEECDY